MGRVLEEIRIMRFEELLDRPERGFLTQAEAGEMLGMTERTFRRWQARSLYRQLVETAGRFPDRPAGIGVPGWPELARRLVHLCCASPRPGAVRPWRG